MATSSVVAFWLVAVLLIAVPGADWAFVIGAAVSRRAVVAAVGGLALGYAVITMVVVAGVGAIVAGSAALLTGLIVVGGAYLVWHGAMTFTHPAHAPSSLETPPAETLPAERGRRVLMRGIGVSSLNPKGLLILLALLPQFTDPHGRLPIAAQIGVLGTVFILTNAAFTLILGTFARTILRAHPTFIRGVSRLAGAGMVVIGAVLIAQRLAGCS